MVKQWPAIFLMRIMRIIHTQYGVGRWKLVYIASNVGLYLSRKVVSNGRLISKRFIKIEDNKGNICCIFTTMRFIYCRYNPLICITNFWIYSHRAEAHRLGSDVEGENNHQVRTYTGRVLRKEESRHKRNKTLLYWSVGGNNTYKITSIHSMPLRMIGVMISMGIMKRRQERI